MRSHIPRSNHIQSPRRIMAGGVSQRKAHTDSQQSADLKGNHQSNTSQKPSQHAVARTQVRHDGGQTRIDSWLSYRNDTADLQSTAGQQTSSALNANAPSFNSITAQPIHDLAQQPQSARSHFTPYRPLRTSNGQYERQVVQRALDSNWRRRAEHVHTTVQEKHIRGSRVNNLATSGLKPDDPIPSVEKSDTVTPAVRLVSSVARIRQYSQPRRSSTKTPPPAPKVTEAYLMKSLQRSERLDAPRKLLVILDLNGTLLFRKNRAQQVKFQMRPGVTPLLDYLFANHVVMVYTSARPENAIGMVDKLMHPNQRHQLVAIWARDKLDLTPAQYEGKVQVYKKLEKIWTDETIQDTAIGGREWDQTNTILIDDSHLKALAQPHNLLQVPEFVNNRPRDEKDMAAMQEWSKAQQKILKGLEAKLEELKWMSNVSAVVRLWQTGEESVSTYPGQKMVVEESMDQHEQMRLQGNIDLDVAQLLSPESPVKTSEVGKRGGMKKDRANAINTNSTACGIDSEAGDKVRSVSPIHEGVWQAILRGDEAGADGQVATPRTSNSLERDW